VSERFCVMDDLRDSLAEHSPAALVVVDEAGGVAEQIGGVVRAVRQLNRAAWTRRDLRGGPG